MTWVQAMFMIILGFLSFTMGALIVMIVVLLWMIRDARKAIKVLEEVEFQTDTEEFEAIIDRNYN